MILQKKDIHFLKERSVLNFQNNIIILIWQIYIDLRKLFYSKWTKSISLKYRPNGLHSYKCHYYSISKSYNSPQPKAYEIHKKFWFYMKSEIMCFYIQSFWSFWYLHVKMSYKIYKEIRLHFNIKNLGKTETVIKKPSAREVCILLCIFVIKPRKHFWCISKCFLKVLKSIWIIISVM